MQSPILIVIDMLNDFLDPWETTRREDLIRSILAKRTDDLVRPIRLKSQTTWNSG
jgi:hypothetical protein